MYFIDRKVIVPYYYTISLKAQFITSVHLICFFILTFWKPACPGNYISRVIVFFITFSFTLNIAYVTHIKSCKLFVPVIICYLFIHTSVFPVFYSNTAEWR